MKMGSTTRGTSLMTSLKEKACITTTMGLFIKEISKIVGLRDMEFGLIKTGRGSKESF